MSSKLLGDLAMQHYTDTRPQRKEMSSSHPHTQNNQPNPYLSVGLHFSYPPADCCALVKAVKEII